MKTTNKKPKHPDVVVKLTEQDGNAFAIMGKVSKALKSAGYTESQKAFMEKATSGDYNHLLQTVMEFVVVK